MLKKSPATDQIRNFFCQPWAQATLERYDGNAKPAVHNYFETNYHIVADTVRNELPPLRSKLADVLAKENKIAKIKKKGLRPK